LSRDFAASNLTLHKAVKRLDFPAIPLGRRLEPSRADVIDGDVEISVTFSQKLLKTLFQRAIDWSQLRLWQD
jgi:hypothetical protein